MRLGRVRSLIDMQIAATAFQAGMTLVTRNVKDMEGSGVRLLNPFD
jgi:predicted nucleic acid-binding protein